MWNLYHPKSIFVTWLESKAKNDAELKSNARSVKLIKQISNSMKRTN